MTDRFKAVLDIYLSIENEYMDTDDLPEGFDQDLNLRDALASMIVAFRKPQIVADILSYETEELKREALIVMIERDAADIYDQVDGYVDWVSDEVERIATEENGQLDGEGICKWIDANCAEQIKAQLTELEPR